MACERKGIGDSGGDEDEGPQPFCSVQLVMVDSVRAGELSRTHFRPQRRSWRTPDHVACGGESPEIFSWQLLGHFAMVVTKMNHDDDSEDDVDDDDDVDGDDDDVADDDVNDQMTYLLSVTVSFVST